MMAPGTSLRQRRHSILSVSRSAVSLKSRPPFWPLETIVQQRFCLRGSVIAGRYGLACCAASSISAATSLGCDT